jgi:hypothetical protein
LKGRAKIKSRSAAEELANVTLTLYAAATKSVNTSIFKDHYRAEQLHLKLEM